MNATADAPATPDLDATLAALTALTMRAAGVVTRMLEIEQAAAEVAAAWLPEPGSVAASLAAALEAGQAIDAVTTAMAQAVPRTEILARALDRLARSVRRTVALRKRMQAGWPRATADNRPAMLRRQVARAVADQIRQQADGETAERLFDELDERLDDPTLAEDLQSFPVEQVVRRVCRDLGLVAAALQPLTRPQKPPYPPSPVLRGRSGQRFHGPPPVEGQRRGGSG